MKRKTKSKARLDKFYRFAKEQGYRSRASFKLIQLNNKYNFLSSCRALVDLCAAPGGWLQVAQKFMPMGSIKIGVDLDPIKRIPGVKTFQEDITTQKCIDLLKKELGGEKADVFLNDGAPNVGANWDKDAHNQSELVLAALKLTSMFLRQGGYFVTKVFRSADFNSLIWVFNKFFKKVEITKPQASRFSSAEIFVVCIGYLAPTFIDEKLFDPKEVFKTTERDFTEEQTNREITSLDKLMEKRRHRGGYADDAPQHLYKEINFTNFIEADNPFPIFMDYNKMIVNEEEKSKYFGLAKAPEDWEQLFEDLKVLGKRDVSILLKWRGKIKQALYKDSHQPKNKVKAPKEVDSEEELERELLEKTRKQHKQLRKEREREDHQILMSKAIIEGHVHDDNMEESFGDALDEHDIEELGYESVSQEEPAAAKIEKKVAYRSPQEMEAGIEEMYEMRKAKIAEKTKQIQKVRQTKKGKQKGRDVDDERLKASRIEQEEPDIRSLGRDRILDSHILQQDTKLKFRNPLATQMDDEDIYISDADSDDPYEGVEVDPNERVPGELDDDNVYKVHKPTTDMEKRRKQLNRKAKKEERANKDQKETAIEVVPTPKTIQDYDIDGLAETLAIAKKMVRGRLREDIITDSYSRYNFEDEEKLPTWFKEDEQKHNFKSMPITKEEFQREKNRIAAINARAPKKVLEAMCRRKIKMMRKLKKTKQRAEKIMEQEGVGEYHKMKEVNKIYQKEFRDNKKNKKYVVSKGGKTVGGKDSRSVKHVDSRLKKDKRTLKKRIKKTRHVHRKHKRQARF